MISRPLKVLNHAPLKTKQVTVQKPEHQAAVLREYCARHELTADAVVLAALCAMIEGFEKA